VAETVLSPRAIAMNRWSWTCARSVRGRVDQAPGGPLWLAVIVIDVERVRGNIDASRRRCPASTCTMP